MRTALLGGGVTRLLSVAALSLQLRFCSGDNSGDGSGDGSHSGDGSGDSSRSGDGSRSGECPCQNTSLCKPISGSEKFEVFVFDVGGKNWQFYDWSQVTTVVSFGKYDPELMCFAHSKGARVVLKGDISVKKIVDPDVRAAWISQQVDLAKRQYMDGINFDIEQNVKNSSAEYHALTDLVKEATEAFHKEIPGSQVTFDVPWSPDYVERCYNYSEITHSCDFIFVMSYDERSKKWSNCIVGANAPYNQTLTGYSNYMSMGINPKKLVMGVPWYGYDYTCLSFTVNHICSFGKPPCHDSAGHQVPYKVIMNQINKSHSEILWDKEEKAPYFEYKDSNGTLHQVWFDNPKSISMKAAYVKELGLRGIGMWNADCLDYSNTSIAQNQTKAMWEALKPKSTQND